MAVERQPEATGLPAEVAALGPVLLEPLLAASPLGIAILDADGRARYLNPAFTTMVGGEPADVDHLLGDGAPEDHGAARFARLLRGDIDEYTTERRLARREGDGVAHDALVRLHVSRRHDGSDWWVVVQVEDLTETAAATAVALAAQERYQALSRHASEGILVIGADGRLRYANAAVERVLGYPAEEVTRTATDAIIHPDDRARWRDDYRRVRARPGERVTVEVRGLHADGRHRWLEATVVNSLDDPAIAGVVVHFHDVSDRHRAIQDLLHQAVHDGLTGLPNRALLLDRLGHALDRAARADAPRVAVLFLDVDHFKRVNDSLGHAGGDELLGQVAARLRTAVRPSDTVARLGGDEFVVCCEDVGRHEAVALADRVLEVFSTPFPVAGHEIHVSTSVGIALAERPSDTPETLLRDADAAMYVAKSHGRSRFEVFDDAIRDRVLRRLETADDLHRALANDELVLHYQPVWDIETTRVVGTEALVRWQHPTRGLLPPAEFLPVAAESGLIVQIGEWILNEASRQRREWDGIDPTGTYQTMWVNLSAHQLARLDCFDVMAGIIVDHALEPGTIGVEITEPILMDSDRTDAASRGLLRLADLGCRLAIDDFGTGYSSLRYVYRYPIDTLKVDGTVVRNLPEDVHDLALARAVVELGRILGAGVSAEGVETTAQLEAARDLGCTTVSGYLLGGPTTAAELTNLLRGDR